MVITPVWNDASETKVTNIIAVMVVTECSIKFKYSYMSNTLWRLLVWVLVSNVAGRW